MKMAFKKFEVPKHAKYGGITLMEKAQQNAQTDKIATKCI